MAQMLGFLVMSDTAQRWMALAPYAIPIVLLVVGLNLAVWLTNRRDGE